MNINHAINSNTDNLLVVQKYRPDIDGLRAIAVLLVIAYHAFPLKFKGGFIGVDIFFVISGYLITNILFISLKQDKFSFLEFYRRRINRIFPSLILVLISCLAIGWFVLFQDEYKQLGSHVRGATQFISNLILWKESGYFDNTSDTKPLLHLWSLGIEEQFYIIWPLLLWIALKLKFNWLVLCVLGAIISFKFYLNYIHSDSIAAFYFPQTRFWELLIGSILAYLSSSQQSILANRWHMIQSILGAILIVAGVLFISKENYFYVVWLLVPVLGVSLIISAGPHTWLNQRIFSNSILVWFGLISFPLYLWHWPILSFTRIVVGGTPSNTVQIIAILLSVFLAGLSYFLLEKPIRFGQDNKAKTMTLVLIMLLIGITGYEIDTYNGIQDRPIAKNALDFNYKRPILGSLACKDTTALTYLSKLDIDFCLVNNNGKFDSAIIGDSHAEDKFHGLIKNDKRHNWILLANNSCPPTYGISVELGKSNCRYKFTHLLNWIINEPKIKTVALSFYGNYFLTTNYAADHLKLNIGPNSTKITSSNGYKSRTETFEQGLNDTIQLLQRANKQVILFVDVPELPFFPKDCFRNPLLNCTLRKKEVELRQYEQRQMIQRLKAHNSNLLIFDPIQLFCKGAECTYYNHEAILYRDSHHLTLKGSEVFGKYFVEWDQRLNGIKS